MSGITVEMFLRFLAPPRDPRGYIRHPIGTETDWYATNGHVLLRVPAGTFVHVNFAACIDAPFVPPPPGFVAQMDGVIDSAFARVDSFAPAPEVILVRGQERCEECFGQGVVWCDYGHSHDCEECDGRGERSRKAYQGWCGQTFNAEYLARIHALPGAALALPALNDQREQLVPLAFRCSDGGMGVIMPCDSTRLPAAMVGAA